MSKKKPVANKPATSLPASDRHKPRRMAGVRKGLADALEEAAKQRSTDFTELVNVAVREFLERAGLWPPAA